MIRNNKGAASILVIVMMLVLVVFGLAMVTTVLAQVRLSRSHETWVRDYYDLEREAQGQIHDIDQVIYQTEMEVINYLKVGAIGALDYTGPIIGHAEYYEGFSDESTRTRQNQYLNQIFIEIYDQQLLYNLETYAETNQDVIIKVRGRVSGFSEIEISGIITNQLDSYKKNITFMMKPEMPEYVLSYDGVRIDGYKDMSVDDRYVLTSYEQWQEGFEMEETIEFENPF